MKVSVCVTTYNKSDILEKTLAHVGRMRRLPEEVLICDDGSGPETAAMLERVGKEYPVKLRHIWQEDKGWRVTKARNNGVRAAHGDYLLFLDGDCLPHPRWLEDHLRLAEKGRFVLGDRVHVKEDFVKNFRYRFPGILFDVLRKRLAKRWLVVRNPLEKPYCFRLAGVNARRLAQMGLGCNFGAWKEDLEKVNGFNEALSGWSLEDIELFARLLAAGCEAGKVYRHALVFHLDHGKSTYDEAKVFAPIEAVFATGEYWVEPGLQTN